MRILYLSTESLDKDVGTTIRIREISRQWALMGHDVRIVAPRYGRSASRPLPVPISFVRLPSKNIVSYVLFEICALLYVPLKAYWDNVDVVLSTGSLNSSALFFLLRLIKKAYIVEVNGIADLEVQRRRASAVIAHSYSWLIRHSGLYRCADFFICVASGIQDELADRWIQFRMRSIVIGNGVDLDDFQLRDKYASRKELGLDERAFIFGFVGSLCPWHGTEDLLSAAKILRTRGRLGFKIVIVGEGENLASLEDQAKNDSIDDLVLFAGQVASLQVPLFLNSFDVACQTHNDPEIGRLGDSMKFWEYLASGLPVIVSDLSGSSQHIERGVIGLAYKGGDPYNLADCMEEFLDRPSRCTDLRSENRRYAANGHRWQDISFEIAAVLAAQLEESR